MDKLDKAHNWFLGMMILAPHYSIRTRALLTSFMKRNEVSRMERVVFWKKVMYGE